MPNQPTHAAAGTLVGLVAALYHAKGETSANQMLETIGGMLGGRLGGVLPDIFEPALTPRHRRFAHSAVAVYGVAAATLENWRRQCRGWADHYERLVAGPVLDETQRLWYIVAALCWRLLAGFLGGLQAGCLSHLALDACTPCGLPLLC